jgi:3D (Asp-Asp-Asp) domain-containing protein
MRILATLALVASLVSAFPVNAQAKTDGVLNQNTKKQIKMKLDKKENANSDKKDVDISLARPDGQMTWQDNIVLAVYVPNVFKKKYEKFARTDGISKIELPNGDFVINASAYTAAADECGKSDGITASGRKVAENRTLACPKGYAFGTQIEIDGMGTYTCEDRGGAIKGNHFDIYMKTKAQAFAFGRRNLTARVVK